MEVAGMKTVRVQSMPGHAYAMQIGDGRHELVSDEPVADGGDDAGPEPYELLLAALGSCMAITMKMYAARKAWALDSVVIELTHEKVLARDCDACTPEEIAALGPQGRVDVFHTGISVRGELSRDEVARLHEIAGRCPVHRTLEASPKFVSTISWSS